MLSIKSRILFGMKKTIQRNCTLFEPIKSLSYDLVDYYIVTNEIQFECFESLTEHSDEDLDLTQFRFN